MKDPELAKVLGKEDGSGLKALGKLGAHPNRFNLSVLRGRIEFDELAKSNNVYNPHTGSEMFDPETGGYVTVEPGHNVTFGDPDSKAEFTVAEAFSRTGRKVTLLNENLPDGIKTPDAYIEGLGIFDFKNISTKAINIIRNVRDKIINATSQAENIAINLGDRPGINMDDINRGILDALVTPGSRPKNIAIVYPDGTLKVLTPQEFLNGKRF